MTHESVRSTLSGSYYQKMLGVFCPMYDLHSATNVVQKAFRTKAMWANIVRIYQAYSAHIKKLKIIIHVSQI